MPLLSFLDRRSGSADESDTPTTLVAAKAPLSRGSMVADLDSRLTLPQALQELRRFTLSEGDPDTLLVLQQVVREQSAQHSYLAIGPKGELSRVDDPSRTTVAEIARSRAVRTPDGGVDTVQIAAFEVQAYAPVG